MDDLFWDEYLQFPMDDLLSIIDEQLQDQSELNHMQEECSEGESIDDYLNKDIFATSPMPIPSSPPIPIPIQLHTEQINFPFTLQFVFPAEHVPPFHFLT